MTADELFGMAGQVAIVGWAALILGPRRFPWFNRLPALVVPGVLSLLYALLALTKFAEADGGFGSLDQVRQLFANDWALLAGWVHYLAFDLMVGAAMAARLDRAGVTRLVQAPILVLIFLLDPLGALLALLTEASSRSGSLAGKALRSPTIPTIQAGSVA